MFYFIFQSVVSFSGPSVIPDWKRLIVQTDWRKMNSKYKILTAGWNGDGWNHWAVNVSALDQERK